MSVSSGQVRTFQYAWVASTCHISNNTVKTLLDHSWMYTVVSIYTSHHLRHELVSRISSSDWAGPDFWLTFGSLSTLFRAANERDRRSQSTRHTNYQRDQIEDITQRCMIAGYMGQGCCRYKNTYIASRHQRGVPTPGCLTLFHDRGNLLRRRTIAILKQGTLDVASITSMMTPK